MAVVAVYKLNSELRSIFLENKNGMGSAASYLFAKTLLVFPILFCFALAALGIPGFLIQNFPRINFFLVKSCSGRYKLRRGSVLPKRSLPFSMMQFLGC